MFKNAWKIAVSFCLLVGAFAGYTRLFAIVTHQMEVARQKVGVPFPVIESNSAKRAAELARESFPAGHWTTDKGLKLQWYDAVHGMYMYAQEYEPSENRKRIHVKPFAVISLSKDGKKRQTATSDEAIIDLSQPFLQSGPTNEKSKVVHATMIGDVRLRDDKGTIEDFADDLRVGPMNRVDFDDAALQITSDSDIILQDRDLTLNGIGLLIKLRRKVGSPESGGTSGFDAETVFVYRDVHIVVNNVTQDGVLPGKAKPEKSGKIPIDVRCDREMRIDLPLPRPQVAVGPPDLDRPPDPTFVKFKTNVRVIRGTDKLDRLDSDTLDLTLMPDPRKKTGGPDEYYEPGEEPAGVADEGPLTELKIRIATARGDAVWLSPTPRGWSPAASS